MLLWRGRWVLLGFFALGCGPTVESNSEFACDPRPEGWDRDESHELLDWSLARGVGVHGDKTVLMVNAGDSATDGQRFLIGLGSEGGPAWEQHAPSGVGRALAMAPDGGVLVCDDVSGTDDHRVTRFAPDGQVVWSTIGAEFCGGMGLTDMGVVAVGGPAEVSRFTLGGEALPSWPIEAPGHVTNLAIDGNEVVLLGSRGHEGFWVGRMDQHGELGWVSQAGTSEDAVQGIAIAVTRSGAIIVGGYVGLLQGGPTGVGIPTGLWSFSPDGELREAIAGGFGEVSGRIDDVFAMPSGAVVVTGRIRAEDHDRLLVAEVAENGDVLWLQSAGHARIGCHGRAVAVDSCGSVHVAGTCGGLAGWLGRYNLPER